MRRLLFLAGKRRSLGREWILIFYMATENSTPKSSTPKVPTTVPTASPSGKFYWDYLREKAARRKPISDGLTPAQREEQLLNGDHPLAVEYHKSNLNIILDCAKDAIATVNAPTGERAKDLKSRFIFFLENIICSTNATAHYQQVLQVALAEWQAKYMDVHKRNIELALMLSEANGKIREWEISGKMNAVTVPTPSPEFTP